MLQHTPGGDMLQDMEAVNALRNLVGADTHVHRLVA